MCTAGGAQTDRWRSPKLTPVPPPFAPPFAAPPSSQYVLEVVDGQEMACITDSPGMRELAKRHDRLIREFNLRLEVGLQN